LAPSRLQMMHLRFAAAAKAGPTCAGKAVTRTGWAVLGCSQHCGCRRSSPRRAHRAGGGAGLRGWLPKAAAEARGACTRQTRPLRRRHRAAHGLTSRRTPASSVYTCGDHRQQRSCAQALRHQCMGSIRTWCASAPTKERWRAEWMESWCAACAWMEAGRGGLACCRRGRAADRPPRSHACRTRTRACHAFPARLLPVARAAVRA
jgi:hypothetical protein